MERFDEIADGYNQLGSFTVTVDGQEEVHDYEGMEDGLAIAKAVTENDALRYRLFTDKQREIQWVIPGDKARRHKHRIKMAKRI